MKLNCLYKKIAVLGTKNRRNCLIEALRLATAVVDKPMEESPEVHSRRNDRVLYVSQTQEATLLICTFIFMEKKLNDLRNTTF